VRRIHVLYYFFFQEQYCIRDDLVTGVQTCALPISLPAQVHVIPALPEDQYRQRERRPSGNSEGPAEFEAQQRYGEDRRGIEVERSEERRVGDVGGWC